MKKIVFMLVFITTQHFSETVSHCKEMEMMWLTYGDMAAKAFMEEKDITKATKLQKLAVETAENMLKVCPDDYWLKDHTDQNKTVQFWKDDMQLYIDKTNAMIKKHDGI
ncbi:hypothetical protein PGH07_07895 [Sulfurovum sp. zt1-1]|uniref:Uncharacterized protein n=1 Tax=Sulfurovum zhangzhouensis TaxID=3019067 RepID=A0ABT7QZ32_9BACT|nr:hypothetical protein [Sulfurovum zhangzhouensis]MDM5272099.1 hypothetical protein [Sulfurovum zhangzhouensis]